MSKRCLTFRSLSTAAFGVAAQWPARIGSNVCPLCYREDSRVWQSSPFGGWRHRDLVKSYVARHNEAGKSILKAITKGTNGNNVFIADLGRKENMQAIGALGTSLLGWPKRPLLQDREQRDSLGITAPEDRLEMRPDIMILDLILPQLITLIYSLKTVFCWVPP